jgi:hypothetical protein
MGIFKPLCPNYAQAHFKDGEQLRAPFANRLMPLLCLKPGKYQQQNEAALEDMGNDPQYGEETAKGHIKKMQCTMELRVQSEY